MDSSVSPKDEIWFLRVCHHILTALCNTTGCLLLKKTRNAYTVTDDVKEILNPLGASYAAVRLQQERQLNGFIQTSFKLSGYDV